MNVVPSFGVAIDAVLGLGHCILYQLSNAVVAQMVEKAVARASVVDSTVQDFTYVAEAHRE